MLRKNPCKISLWGGLIIFKKKSWDKGVWVIGTCCSSQLEIFPPSYVSLSSDSMIQSQIRFPPSCPRTELCCLIRSSVRPWVSPPCHMDLPSGCIHSCCHLSKSRRSISWLPKCLKDLHKYKIWSTGLS